MAAPAPALAEMATTTTTSSRVEETGRMSSIELEPKTLTLHQIKFAREAALYVVSTKTEEEAIRIFTEGLKPVQIAVRKSSSAVDSSSDDDVDLGSCSSSTKGCSCGRGGGGSKGGGRRGGRRRQDSVDDRDVATAPF